MDRRNPDFSMWIFARPEPEKFLRVAGRLASRAARLRSKRQRAPPVNLQASAGQKLRLGLGLRGVAAVLHHEMVVQRSRSAIFKANTFTIMLMSRSLSVRRGLDKATS